MKSIEELNQVLNKHKTFSFNPVFNHGRMFNVYEKYAENISDRKIFLGFDSIDKGMNGLRPSEIMTVVAGTNIGKSAFAMNIMYNATKKTDGLIFLFSLEMSEIDIIERYIQMELDINTYEVENIFIHNDKWQKEKILEKIYKCQNIIAIIKRINIDEIIPYVLAMEEIEKKESVFIIIDHFGLIENSQYRDPYSKATNNMMKIREVSLHLKKPVMLLSQTSRENIKSKEGLNLYSGKDSGEIENTSQIYFTLQKQKEIDLNTFDTGTIELAQQKKIDILKLKCEKKKRGDYSETDIIFTRKNLRMTEYFKPPDLF